jgi:hypothetical protein
LYFTHAAYGGIHLMDLTNLETLHLNMGLIYEEKHGIEGLQSLTRLQWLRLQVGTNAERDTISIPTKMPDLTYLSVSSGRLMTIGTSLRP